MPRRPHPGGGDDDELLLPRRKRPAPAAGSAEPGAGRAQQAASSAPAASASSFLALKADLAAHRSGGAGPSSLSQPPRARALPHHLRPARGAEARRQRDGDGVHGGATSAWAGTPAAALDAARAAMERKARLYAALRAGKEAGVDEATWAQMHGSVDWERKAGDASGSGDESDSGASARGGGGDDDDDDAADPLVEYEDEFGRTRMLPRRDVPREWLRQKEREAAAAHEPQADDSDVVYGPATSFPVYRPPSPVLAARAAAIGKAAAPSRFDATAEVRDRGAGFYAFSADEARRAEEQAALRRASARTAEERAGAAALPISAEEQQRQERRREVERKRREVEERRRARSSQGQG